MRVATYKSTDAGGCTLGQPSRAAVRRYRRECAWSRRRTNRL